MNPKENPQRIRMTDGAGYIGSYMTHLLKESGYQVIVFDNLSTRRVLA